MDVQLEIGFCTRDQIVRMFRSFYPGTEANLAERFADQVKDSQLSAAHVQGFFLCHKDDPHSAVANSSEWARTLPAHGGGATWLEVVVDFQASTFASQSIDWKKWMLNF